MVRLLGKINETALVPTHDKIIRSGEVLVGTGGTGAATVEINTGFHSVMLAWFTYNMKQPPGPNATIAPAGAHLYVSDTPTYGATIVAAFSTVTTGYATLEWFGIGDL